MSALRIALTALSSNRTRGASHRADLYITSTAANGERVLVVFRGDEVTVRVTWRSQHAATITRLKEKGVRQMTRSRKWLIKPVAGEEVSLVFLVLPLFDASHDIGVKFFPYLTTT